MLWLNLPPALPFVSFPIAILFFCLPKKERYCSSYSLPLKQTHTHTHTVTVHAHSVFNGLGQVPTATSFFFFPFSIIRCLGQYTKRALQLILENQFHRRLRGFQLKSAQKAPYTLIQKQL